MNYRKLSRESRHRRSILANITRDVIIALTENSISSIGVSKVLVIVSTFFSCISPVTSLIEFKSATILKCTCFKKRSSKKSYWGS